jgi:type I site-specific restriction endonuclease
MNIQASINANEATATDLRVIDELKKLGWKVGDTLLYQPQYPLTPEQQKEFPGHKYVKPDIVLQDLQGTPLAVFENKLDDPKKGLPKLRLLYSHVLRPRYLYACSAERTLFYDMAWTGLEAGEFRPVNSFLSLEDMNVRAVQEQTRRQGQEIVIDKTIAGGFDYAAGKERYFQADCINALLKGLREGCCKMLVHMATGLGKTRTTVALCKALLDIGLARRILFVVDRRLLAEQVRDDGFSLISPTYTAGWITTGNYKGFKHRDIHVAVIDTLEIIYSGIPSTYYDLLIVDECHRSINVSRKVIFDHFLCPRIGLTATPRIAIPKDPKKVSDDDLAILDTYRLFGCEVGDPTYQFDLGRGIEEGFLAPYKVDEIKTHLTQIAEAEGVEFDYVLDPDERKKIELDKTKKLKLEQLNRKYLTENTAKRIAEEIRNRTEYGEKMILFGVSQAHCIMLANALNEVFDDEGKSPRYSEPIISENADLNRTLKGWFKDPRRKPYIALSVDIMSTGVDIPCVRYIGFAALTRSVGKYIQMLGRGTRLDPKSGKYSFQVLDFVGLCKRMNDNGKGTEKKNEKVVVGGTGGGGDGGGEPEGYFIVDNPDPEHQIQRVKVHAGGVRVVENIPIEEAKRIFEAAVTDPASPAIVSLKQKLEQQADYEPTPEDIATVEDWVSKPEIWLDEGNLQRMYDFPAGSVWDFFLHVLGKRRIPTPLERVQTGYDNYIRSAEFTEAQVEKLRQIKDVFIAAMSEHGKVDARTIFANPIYEQIIGRYQEVNQLFHGKLDDVIETMCKYFKLPKAA